MSDRLLCAIQFWLQGWPDRSRPSTVVRVGNALSRLRYWIWARTLRSKDVI